MRSVCFVHTSPAMVSLLLPDAPHAIGGSELQLCLLARELKDRGWQVHFLVGDVGQDWKIQTDEGFHVWKAYTQPDRLPPWRRVMSSLLQLRNSVLSVDADIYISRGLSGQAGPLRSFTRGLGAPYLLWCANNGDAKNGALLASDLPLSERLPAWYGVRGADSVVVQTAEQRKLLKNHTGREGFVIPNLSPWEPDETCFRREGHILWVGSIRAVKRPSLVLDVARRIPEVPFVIVGGKMKGSESLHDHMVEQAASLENVEFLGFVPFEGTYPLFRDASMLLSTSVSEGFPNVFLQAWSTATPVVATCDPDGVIERHRLGVHCPETDSLADNVRKLYRSDGLRSEMAKCALQYVQKNHSSAKVTTAVVQVLQNVLENFPHSPKRQRGER